MILLRLRLQLELEILFKSKQIYRYYLLFARNCEYTIYMSGQTTPIHFTGRSARLDNNFKSVLVEYITV